jgi:hypothetical protein
MRRSVRSLVLVLTLLSLLVVVSSVCSAQRFRSAPVNPDYVAYRDALVAGRLHTVTAGGHGLVVQP